jgi:F-type H+-transporting ATPase subunit alpha
LQNVRRKGAMAYTIIVANASDPAPMQVYAPFAGAAIENILEIQVVQL